MPLWMIVWHLYWIMVMIDYQPWFWIIHPGNGWWFNDGYKLQGKGGQNMFWAFFAFLGVVSFQQPKLESIDFRMLMIGGILQDQCTIWLSCIPGCFSIRSCYLLLIYVQAWGIPTWRYTFHWPRGSGGGNISKSKLCWWEMSHEPQWYQSPLADLPAHASCRSKTCQEAKHGKTSELPLRVR